MSTDHSFTTRRNAMTLGTFQGKELAHVSRETGLRLFHSSPGAATLQLRHDSGKRHTYLSASLELDELKALRGMVDAVIAQIGKKS